MPGNLYCSNCIHDWFDTYLLVLVFMNLRTSVMTDTILSRLSWFSLSCSNGSQERNNPAQLLFQRLLLFSLELVFTPDNLFLLLVLVIKNGSLFLIASCTTGTPTFCYKYYRVVLNSFLVFRTSNLFRIAGFMTGSTFFVTSIHNWLPFLVWVPVLYNGTFYLI